jgi:isopenicillin N synthase-like dioxygenase
MYLGPNMWPREELLPGFRAVIEEYMDMMGEVAAKFLSLVAEAIGLPPNSFDQFFEPKDSRWKQQHKLKIVKYPDVADLPAGATTQGVGPHKGPSCISLSVNNRLYVIELSITSYRPSRTTGTEWKWRLD